MNMKKHMLSYILILALVLCGCGSSGKTPVPETAAVTGSDVTETAG